jgi:hypothetical protein
MASREANAAETQRPACRRHVLEGLRQPLEEDIATITSVWAEIRLIPHSTVLKDVFARA